MSSRKNPRRTKRWKRIRQAVGVCVGFNAGEHADCIYATVLGREGRTR